MVKAMQEELDQFQKNDIWKLAELPKTRKLLDPNGSAITS